MDSAAHSTKAPASGAVSASAGSAQARPVAPPSSHLSSAEPPVSILLVDDDQNNLLALESILDFSDYRLVKAQSADAALLALMQDEYAAIVLDVQMPDLSGIELARLIKQR